MWYHKGIRSIAVLAVGLIKEEGKNNAKLKPARWRRHETCKKWGVSRSRQVWFEMVETSEWPSFSDTS